MKKEDEETAVGELDQQHASDERKSTTKSLEMRRSESVVRFHERVKVT